MSKIVDIQAREILDSRGNPTVEVDVTLCCGAFGRAAVPSRRQHRRTRSHRTPRRRQEALSRQRRAEGRQQCHRRSSRPSSSAWTRCDQLTVDATMLKLDGTETKSKLGANAILAVSLANAKAAAAASEPAAVQISRRAERESAARADGQRHQRRRAFGRAD